MGVHQRWVNELLSKPLNNNLEYVYRMCAAVVLISAATHNTRRYCLRAIRNISQSFGFRVKKLKSVACLKTLIEKPDSETLESAPAGIVCVRGKITSQLQ